MDLNYLEVIDTIELAKTYLKNGEVLLCVNNKTVSYLILNNNMLTVKSKNLTYKVTIDELDELFNNNKFYLVEMKVIDNEIDPLKDEEYYSWWHK